MKSVANQLCNLSNVQVSDFLSLDARAIELWNVILLRGCGLDWRCDRANITLEVESPIELSSLVWVSLKNNVGSLLIGQSRGLIDLLIKDIREDIDFDSLPENLAMAVLSVALEPFLRSLEQHLGSSIGIDSIDSDCRLNSADPISLNLTVGFPNGTEEPLRIRCDSAFAPHYIKSLQSLTDSSKSAKKSNLLPVPVVLSIGWSRISFYDANSLDVGDVILIESPVHKDITHVRVHIGSCCVTSGKLDRGRVFVVGEPGELKLDRLPEEMQDTSHIDKVSVKLDFDIGSTEIKFSELSELKEGYVFDLEGRLGADVTIRCGWRIVGTGKLVNLDNRHLGVMLVQLADSNSQE